MTIRPAPRPLVVVGAGGHGREVLDVIEAINAVELTWRITGVFAQIDPGDLLAVRGIAYLGPLRPDTTRTTSFVVGIGDPADRDRVAAVCVANGWEPATLVHPGASIGTACTLGGGSVLFAGSMISTAVTLGSHVHVNVRASISHDSSIAAYATIGPAAVVCGSASVGMRAYIGAGAVVLPGVAVGDDAVVGAGAVVVRDVAKGATVKGVPAS